MKLERRRVTVRISKDIEINYPNEMIAVLTENSAQFPCGIWKLFQDRAVVQRCIVDLDTSPVHLRIGPLLNHDNTREGRFERRTHPIVTLDETLITVQPNAEGYKFCQMRQFSTTLPSTLQTRLNERRTTEVKSFS